MVARLREHEVEYVIDVRSHPYSKYSPEFSKEALAAALRREGIEYVFMGDSLGGRPDDPSCYSDGKVVYAEVEQRAWYRAGIERLRSAYEQGRRVALMCGELDPERCHRSKLIGHTLEREALGVQHIDRDGSLVPQLQVMDRLSGGQIPMFGDSDAVVTRPTR